MSKHYLLTRMYNSISKHYLVTRMYNSISKGESCVLTERPHSELAETKGKSQF